MPQLVGTNCAICQARISNEMDARFCDACARPRHDGCARPPGSPTQNQCGACGTTGGPVAPQGPTPGRPPVTPPQGPFPVARVCPKCRSANHKRVKPLAWVAFRWDRVCKECRTRYTPPTPTWAALIFLMAGFLLAGLGVGSVFLALAPGNVFNPLGMVCEGFLGIIGCLAIVHGIRSLIKPGEV